MGHSSSRSGTAGEGHTNSHSSTLDHRSQRRERTGWNDPSLRADISSHPRSATPLNSAQHGHLATLPAHTRSAMHGSQSSMYLQNSQHQAMSTSMSTLPPTMQGYNPSINYAPQQQSHQMNYIPELQRAIDSVPNPDEYPHMGHQYYQNGVCWGGHYQS